VSDIGATAIRSEILPYARREDVPPRVLMGAVKHALDRQWANLRFGKVRYSFYSYISQLLRCRCCLNEAAALKLKALPRTVHMLAVQSAKHYCCNCWSKPVYVRICFECDS
jgi:hypothetical protein